MVEVCKLIRISCLLLAVLTFPNVVFATRVQSYECMLESLRAVAGGVSPSFHEIGLEDVDSFLPDELQGRAAPLGIKLYREVRSQSLQALNRITRSGKKNTSDISPLDFAKKFEPGKRYTLVVTHDKMLWAPKEEGGISKWFSKHLFVAGGSKDIRFAGEIWVDRDGILHVDNDSGTFATDPALLGKTLKLLQTNLPGVGIQIQEQTTYLRPISLRKALVTATAPNTPEAMRLLAQDPAIAPLLDTLELSKMDVVSNYDVYVAKNADGEAVVVFKLEDPKNSLRKFLLSWDWLRFKSAVEKNGYSKRNEVNYTIGKKLDFDVVTPTLRARTSDGEAGSVQKYLQGYKDGASADPTWIGKASRHQSQQLFLIDTLMGRADGQPGNWMANSNGDLKMIDTDRILYRSPKAYWQTSTPIEQVFPQAMGEVEGQTREKFLSLTPSDLSGMLNEYGFPEDSIQYAVDRLGGMQRAIRAGEPLEKIVHDFSLLHSSQSKTLNVLLMGKQVASELLGFKNEMSFEPPVPAKPKLPLEQEAKFVIPSKAVLTEMQKMDGQKIEVKGPDGKTVQYEIRKKARLHEDDVYYDTPEMTLKTKGGILRDRKYYLDAGIRIPFKTRLEAKSGAIESEPGVLARENAKGDKLPMTSGRHENAVRDRISGVTGDKAVDYAKSYAGSGDFTPALSATEDVDSMRVYTTIGSRANRMRPVFTISLAEVSFSNPRQGGRSATHLEAEVELADPAPTSALSGQLEQFKNDLKSKYDLVPTDQPKYSTGIDLTALPKIEANQESKKIVILWASLGGGHLSSARAIEARIKAADPSVVVELKDVCDFLPSGLGKLAKSTYLYVAKNIPPIFDWGYKKVVARGLSAKSLSDLKDPYNNDLMATYLRNAHPDVVISTYAGGAQSMGTLRENEQLPKDTKLVWYYSNYAKGYNPRISKRIDQTFVSHSGLEDEFHKAGVDANAIQTSGPSILKDYYEPSDRHQFLTSQGLKPAEKLVVLSGGGEGILDYSKIIHSLSKSITEPFQICAVTGSNPKAYDTLVKLQSKLPSNIRLIIEKKLPPTELSKWVKASDLYIVKAGANSPAEAFVAGKATIVRDIMRGHESKNANFYEQYHLALVNRDSSNIGAQARKIFEDSELRKQMSAAQLEFRNNINLDRITQFVLSPLGESNQKK
jgi:UDP-N-acetylglucosamine:LPS N-acetylglucosamine transferase